MGETGLALHRIALPGGVCAKVYPYADDVIVCISNLRYICIIIKGLRQYKEVTGVVVNLSKSKGLRLAA